MALVAGRRRDLRRAVVRGVAADTRNRHPPGARRAARRAAADVRAPRARAHGSGYRARPHGGRGRDSAHVVAALRDQPARSLSPTSLCRSCSSRQRSSPAICQRAGRRRSIPHSRSGPTTSPDGWLVPPVLVAMRTPSGCRRSAARRRIRRRWTESPRIACRRCRDTCWASRWRRRSA